MIKNVRIYGLEESILASGYPYRLETPDEEEFTNECYAIKYALDFGTEDFAKEHAEETEGHIRRIKRLANNPSGSGHPNALKGIVVQYDLTAPEYFWRQFDRYHFHDHTSSQSKMYSIHKFDIDKVCNKFVSQNTVNELNYWIDLYNHFEEDDLPYITLRNGSKIPYTKKNLFQVILSNCPAGLELTSRINDNYLQLKTKYNQRRTHRLSEWEDYCKWIKSLPMSELITGGR